MLHSVFCSVAQRSCNCPHAWREGCTMCTCGTGSRSPCVMSGQTLQIFQAERDRTTGCNVAPQSLGCHVAFRNPCRKMKPLRDGSSYLHRLVAKATGICRPCSWDRDKPRCSVLSITDFNRNWHSSRSMCSSNSIFDICKLACGTTCLAHARHRTRHSSTGMV